jgi:phage baseplate assembly protein W
MNFVDIPRDISRSDDDKKIYNYGEKALQNSIYNILSTEPGSVPGHPEFGTKLGKYLFELIDPLISAMMEAEIKYAMIRWEPRVDVKSVDIEEDADYNRLSIVMTYIIVRDPLKEERSYVYNTIRK